MYKIRLQKYKLSPKYASKCVKKIYNNINYFNIRIGSRNSLRPKKTTGKMSYIYFRTTRKK
jgi:hypothetical protein